MTKQESFRVEVAYALADEQLLLELEVEPGTTLRQAVERSGVLERYPEIDLDKTKLGIFGKLAKADSEIRPGERVEIYRPLIADPKEVRKQRAAAGKRMSKGGGEA